MAPAICLCMLATYVFVVCSYVWVRNGVEIMRGPRSIIKYKSCVYLKTGRILHCTAQPMIQHYKNIVFEQITYGLLEDGVTDTETCRR
jgi:hypothetical protein